MEKLTIDVEDMHCDACIGHVTKALSGVEGVEDASVSLDSGQAEVTGASLDPDELVRAVAEAGYTAKLRVESQS